MSCFISETGLLYRRKYYVLFDEKVVGMARNHPFYQMGIIVEALQFPP